MGEGAGPPEGLLRFMPMEAAAMAELAPMAPMAPRFDIPAPAAPA